MHRCAFLTLADPSGFVIDDDLAHEPLGELGWGVEAVPWSRSEVDWMRFDAVVVRSTWDYQRTPDRFLDVLRGIASSGVPLFNSLELIEWNLSKGYLLELAEEGVPTVPTLTGPGMEPGGVGELMSRVEAPEIVVKPDVGAGAEGTFRISRGRWRDRAPEVEAYFSNRPFLAQPFIPSVTDEGEWSLVYFNGAYSHAILKIPVAGDFRTQEEFGAEIRPVEPEEHLRRTAERALAALPRPPLYARADLVRSYDPDVFWLMELELIEPSLYLRTDGEAPRRFARALRDAHREWKRERERGHGVSSHGGGRP